MEKPLAASKILMQNYLSELLTEDPDNLIDQKEEKTKKLNKLLQKVNVTEQHKEDLPDVIVSDKSADSKLSNNVFDSIPATKQQVDDDNLIVKKRDSTNQLDVEHSFDKSYRNESFQAMFFDVAGLIVAVPLVELGGIHNVDKITSLMGKPKWFEGVMIHRDEKINVVDTALWVMPEKYNAELKEALNYQYVIMLSNSQWGLLAENLVDTVTLQPEDVKWLDKSSKRPWLAGLVKDRMCALLDVESLIQLLNNGINVQQV